MGRPIETNSYRQRAIREGCSKSTIGYRLGKETRPQGKCKFCGKDLASKNDIQFCNSSCYANHAYRTFIREWQDGVRNGGSEKGDVSGHVRRFLFEKYGDRCARCGWAEEHPITKKIPLEVNHIDGNSANHVEENLELICPNCHSLTGTYRSLNKGRGRSGRK